MFMCVYVCMCVCVCVCVCFNLETNPDIVICFECAFECELVSMEGSCEFIWTLKH